MLETPHVALGATIATKIPNPLISIPLAFASHFLLERVPHWNPHLNTEIKKYGKITKSSKIIVAVDVLFSLGIGFYAASTVSPDTNHSATILIASLASVLPDVIEGPYFFLNMKSKAISNWIKFQKTLQNDTSPLPGLATQVVTLFASFWWMLK